MSAEAFWKDITHMDYDFDRHLDAMSRIFDKLCGKYLHSCPAWDGAFIDEDSYEWDECPCYPEWDED